MIGATAGKAPFVLDGLVGNAALTPLIWSHVNPYGRFDLDMNARMALA